MGPSNAVPYPAWWIERAAKRSALLALAVERLRTVVDESPDLIGALIFGSYAHGTVGPDSDLDVMLITTEPAHGDPGLRYARLVSRLRLDVPCDLIVYEADEFVRLKTERNFVARAVRDGIWIDAATPA